MLARQRLVPLLLIVAVGLAFADASIVALALADLYAEFDTSIVGVSWVLTAYALAVAITAVPLVFVHRRVPPRALLGGGLVLFAASSVAAGAASSLAMLLAARSAQGVGATFLLAAALPVLRDLLGQRARRWWAVAGAVGTAIGPALGGVLTELFDWRAIFFAQAPIAGVAIIAAVRPAPRLVSDDQDVVDAPEIASTGRSSALLANIGFALVFAALVAALFLGVLLAIEVWRYSPLHSALVVSALPLGMIAGRTVRAAPGVWRAVGGAACLALGLLVLALIPGERVWLAVLAFALCGAGFDLLHELLDASAVGHNEAEVRAGATSIGARHAGLVLGLVVIAPVLSSSITDGVDAATFGGARVMIESDLPLSEKLPLTWELHSAIDDARRGEVPDLARTFNERGASGDNALARARDELTDTVTDAVTRAFRPAFMVAAALAALAAVPAIGVARRRQASASAPTRAADRARTARLGLVGLTVAGVALVGVAFGAGAAEVGEYEAADPCTAEADPYPGDGVDAAVQRIVLSALNGAACDLGTTREGLVLSLDEDLRDDDVSWDSDTAHEALRVGARRAIDDAEARDAIPGTVAGLLRFAVETVPVEDLITGATSLF